MGWWLAVVISVVGCGRYNFDHLRDGAGADNDGSTLRPVTHLPPSAR